MTDDPTQIAAEQPAEPVAQPEAQPVALQKPPEQVFREGFEKLTEETGMTLSVVPEWKLRDDGTFSMVVKTAIVPLKR